MSAQSSRVQDGPSHSGLSACLFLPVFAHGLRRADKLCRRVGLRSAHAAIWLRALAGLLAVALMTGCAVQNQGGGRMRIGLDNAQLFGDEVARFALQNGSEGALRVLNGNYSLKLDRYFRVIPIERAQHARIVATEQVGRRTNVLIEAAERGCERRFHLVSIEGNDVLTWQLGNCRAELAYKVEDGMQIFEYIDGRSLQRRIYADGRLFRPQGGGQVARPMTGLGAIVGGPRYVPPPPQVAGPQELAAPAVVPVRAQTVATVPAAVPAPGRSRAQPPVLAPTPARVEEPGPRRTFDFPVQDEQPVRIVLDK